MNILLVSGFFEDLGASFGIGPGNSAQRKGKQEMQWGAEQAGSAAKTLGGLSKVSQATSVANAAKAGQALGEQRGRTNATEGTRSALQAARTSGLNKGQAALTSGQQAGSLYSQGFQSGQDKGIDAYGNATNQRINAATGQAGAGGIQAQAGQGISGQGTAQAGQLGGTIGGIAKGIGGMFAEGGIVDEPTPAIIGEDGKEAVVPLEKPERAAEILKPLTPDHLDTVIALAQKVKELEARLAEPKNA